DEGDANRRDNAHGNQGAYLRRDRQQREQDDGRDRSSPSEPAADPQPQRDVSEHVNRDSNNQADRRYDVQLMTGVVQRSPDPEREQHNAANHRQMEVRVDVSGERGALGGGRLYQPRLRDIDEPIEVRPPQAGNDAETQERGGDDAGVEPNPLGADAERHDRFAQCDQDDLTKALDEVLARDSKTAQVPEQRARVADYDRGDPTGHLG